MVEAYYEDFGSAPPDLIRQVEGLIFGDAQPAHAHAIDTSPERVEKREGNVQVPVAYWIPKAEQFCVADKSGRPFAKAWEPLYAAPSPKEGQP